MHESVLLQETIHGLAIERGDVIIDGTLGRGGHAYKALSVASDTFLIGIDEDEEAIESSRILLDQMFSGRFQLFRGNFRDMDIFLEKAGKKVANKIMLDLGVSSPQIDSSGRGFSFKGNEPLLMTMRRDIGTDKLTARDIVNDWAEEDIANVIFAYGEERYARRIAKAIVGARSVHSIETTEELASIVRASVPASYAHGRLHPATRTFQALRIAVNDELSSLRLGLEKALRALSPSGRIAVISFHSLEDRIVKEAFRSWQKDGLGDSATKKPLVPSEEEIKRNPRSRSAKLRIFIKKA